MATREVSAAEIFEAHRYVMSDTQWWWHKRRLPDGRVLYLMPLLTGNRLGISRDAETCTFEDVWDYPRDVDGCSFIDAGWRAALGWDGEGEPEGWYRHPQSGRRRPDGTPGSEHVRE